MKARKHLSHDSLVNRLSQAFRTPPDERQQAKVDYTIHDALMAGFACHTRCCRPRSRIRICSQIIPLMPEEIRNPDGTGKQDCEINAFKRLIPRIRKDHPQLGLILTGDGLFSNGPCIDLTLEKRMHFIFKCPSPEIAAPSEGAGEEGIGALVFIEGIICHQPIIQISGSYSTQNRGHHKSQHNYCKILHLSPPLTESRQ